MSQDAQIQPARESLGILGYGLRAPAQLLIPTPTPFRWSPAEWEANARRAEAERRETEARVAQEAEAAREEWQVFREQHADSPIVAAVLDIHQPEAGTRGVVCTECLDDDCDGAVATEWPCGTYDAMQGAAMTPETKELACLT